MNKNIILAVLDVLRESKTKYWRMYSGVRLYFSDQKPSKLLYRKGFCLGWKTADKKLVEAYTTKGIREKYWGIFIDLAIILDSFPDDVFIIYFIASRQVAEIVAYKDMAMTQMIPIDVKKVIQDFFEKSPQTIKTSEEKGA